MRKLISIAALIPDRAPGPGEGHIGLHTQQLRVEAAGGALAVDATSDGTTATVTVPVMTAGRPHDPGQGVNPRHSTAPD